MTSKASIQGPRIQRVHSQSLNITHGSSLIQKPVPKPRKSKDGPVIMRKVNVSQSLRLTDSSADKVSDSHINESLGQLFNRNNPKANKHLAGINISRSSSGESLNESLGLLRKSASDSSLSSQRRPVTKHVRAREGSKDMAQSVEFEEFAKRGLVISSSEESHIQKQPLPTPRGRVIRKEVSLVGNKTAAKRNPQAEDFSKQALLLKQSLGSESDSVTSSVGQKKPSKEVSVSRDGKKQVNYSSDFEEYSISTLQSLGDNRVSGKGHEHPQKTKVVQLHSDGEKRVSYTKDVEEFTSHTLEDLYQRSGKTRQKPRHVMSSINTSDGEKRVFYSSDFDTQSLGTLKSQAHNNSDSDLNTVTKSRDKEVTSWVEYKKGRKHVRYSDEFENFSLGQAIQFISKPKKGKQSQKQVDYRDGRKSTTYNEDFQGGLDTRYSDDFESFSESWAVKVKRSSVDLSPVTKHVDYKQGKKHVTYSTELENTLEKTMNEVETATSFKEIALEDIEDVSYTEDFESITAKLPTTTRSLASASLTEDIEQFSSSTQTPHTSIQTSIHQYGDQYSSHREHGLYSESFASITSIPRSESADVGDETSVYNSSRYRTRTDTFSRTGSLVESDTEDESYTLTFSQPTVESVEESPEIKRQAQEAQDTFVTRKLKVLRTQTTKKSRDVPKPVQREKLEGAEAKQLKKFVKDKLNVIHTRRGDTQDTAKPESLNIASCQLRGINVDEPVESMGISRSAIIRLNMENTMSNLEKAVHEEMHDPRTCQHCSDDMSRLAAEQFMWHKKAIVSEKLVKEKMEMQMLQLQDPMWLYAEALRSLPKPTDHREDIYDQLMKPLFESYAKKNSVPTNEAFV